MSVPLINPGQRVLAAGKTGSGKSTWGCFMLRRSPQNWVILNPKHTAAYNSLDDSIVITSLSMKDVEKYIFKHKFIIVNPSSLEADPEQLDNFILELHSSFTGVGLCCDELYSLHKNGVAGKGLIGWLTRGRELKQSFLGLTQRPAWLSKFLYSESDFICGMKLFLDDDRKKMVEMTGREEFRKTLPPHYWLWYTSETEHLEYYQPVPLDG